MISLLGLIGVNLRNLRMKGFEFKIKLKEQACFSCWV